MSTRQWTKKSSEKYIKEGFTKNSKNSYTISKEVGVDNMAQVAKDFNEMSSVEKWQHFLRRRYQEVENCYYPLIDELVQKLIDLDEVNAKNIPDLILHQFAFIKEWQNGDIPSSHVLIILKSMDMNKVALMQLTRRLDNFMNSQANNSAKDYIIPCRAILVEKCAPLYSRYLLFLVKYFSKLVEIDKAQEKITWIEKFTNIDNKTTTSIADYSLNQVMRQLDSQIVPFSQTKHAVGDNIICIDEDMAKGAFSVHWLFAPKCYIDFLKKEFNIKDVMDLDKEASYIKRLIEGYVK
jgi:hypothetical protein